MKAVWLTMDEIPRICLKRIYYDILRINDVLGNDLPFLREINELYHADKLTESEIKNNTSGWKWFDWVINPKHPSFCIKPGVQHPDTALSAIPAVFMNYPYYSDYREVADKLHLYNDDVLELVLPQLILTCRMRYDQLNEHQKAVRGVQAASAIRDSIMAHNAVMVCDIVMENSAIYNCLPFMNSIIKLLIDNREINVDKSVFERLIDILGFDLWLILIRREIHRWCYYGRGAYTIINIADILLEYIQRGTKNEQVYRLLRWICNGCVPGDDARLTPHMQTVIRNMISINGSGCAHMELLLHSDYTDDELVECIHQAERLNLLSEAPDTILLKYIKKYPAEVLANKKTMYHILQSKNTHDWKQISQHIMDCIRQQHVI